MTGIYKITSPTGKVYIGQSIDLVDRIRQYKRLKCKGQIGIYRSLLKHGIESHTFSILHELPNDVSGTVINDYEEFYISQFKECGFEMLNIKSGGGGGGKQAEETKIKIGLKNKGKKMSDPNKVKMSIRMKGKPSWNKGKGGYKQNLTSEQRKVISDRAKSRIFKHSEETKRQFSIDRIGKPSKTKGIPLKPEHRQKLSRIRLGKPLSESAKVKMMATVRARGPMVTKSVLSIADVKEIKKLLNDGNLSQYRIAKNFCVHKVTIFDIKHGKTWKHI